jgi:2-amino-4-hydroxy-6-hydroxymethyldihydropteridine diphosphokinase
LATIFLGLGSNLGDRAKNLKRAVEELSREGITVSKISRTIETEPVGGPPQGKYLNAVLKATTTKPPQVLLTSLKSIEKRLGRKRTVRNGPRPIDIDILLYDDLKMKTPLLTIPHPRMFERDFVLKPLAELAR